LLRIERPPLCAAHARSASAVGPPERKRASHLRTVRSLIRVLRPVERGSCPRRDAVGSGVHDRSVSGGHWGVFPWV
jgi:hypothetical protein